MIGKLLKSKLVKNTFIYTLTDGVNKSVSFLLIPWVSFYLLPEELGVVTNFQVFFNILILLSGQAVVNSVPYFFYSKSKEKIALFVSNLIFVILFFNLFLFIVILFSCRFVESYLQIGLCFQLFALVTVIWALLSNLNLILFRLEDNVKGFAGMQILQTIINFLLVVLLVILLRWGVLGKIYSLVLTASLMGVVNTVLLIKRKYIVFSFDLPSIKESLKFGLPLLPHSLSFWLKNGIDKVLITTFCGLAVNGLYSMALSITSVYVVFLNSFSNAYCPYLQKRISEFTLENEVEEKKRIVKQVYLLALGSFLLWFAALGFAWFCINYIIDKSYIDSFQFVFWLLLGRLFNGFYSFVVQYIYNAKKTLGLGIITFSGSVFQVWLSYVLIQRYGANGVALSSFIGALIVFLLVWLYSNKVYPMPWFSFQK